MEQSTIHFRKKLFSAAMLLLMVFMLPGCGSITSTLATLQGAPKAKTTGDGKIPQSWWVEATLVEGKTTKQEVLDALGTPGSYSENYFRYSFTGPGAKAKITIIHKDGSKMNFSLGVGKHYMLSLDFDNGILRSARV